MKITTKEIDAFLADRPAVKRVPFFDDCRVTRTQYNNNKKKGLPFSQKEAERLVAGMYKYGYNIGLEKK